MPLVMPLGVSADDQNRSRLVRERREEEGEVGEVGEDEEEEEEEGKMSLG